MTTRYVTLYADNKFDIIHDITMDKSRIIEAIIHNERNPEMDVFNAVRNLAIKARLNSMKSPELWIFWSDIDEHKLIKLSKDDPIELITTIRSNGIKIF